uniref:Uncharacterized protein n=1 Tax=Anguilla anguilla TaxID=7936 RepID=A0A0E9UW65_ANGAN
MPNYVMLTNILLLNEVEINRQRTPRNAQIRTVEKIYIIATVYIVILHIINICKNFGDVQNGMNSTLMT